jgi:cysteinyl-tRNA synthetase
MIEAETGLEKIYAFLERITQSAGPDTEDHDQQEPGKLWERFCETMDDDFNTARAMGLVFDTLRQLNRIMDEGTDAANGKKRARLESVRADLKRVGLVLGIGTEAPSYFFEQKKAKALEREAIDKALVERLITERVQARQQKNWAWADQIRGELAAMNIVLEDRPEGTVWKAK